MKDVQYSECLTSGPRNSFNASKSASSNDISLFALSLTACPAMGTEIQQNKANILWDKVLGSVLFV